MVTFVASPYANTALHAVPRRQHRSTLRLARSPNEVRRRRGTSIPYSSRMSGSDVNPSTRDSQRRTPSRSATTTDHRLPTATTTEAVAAAAAAAAAVAAVQPVAIAFMAATLAVTRAEAAGASAAGASAASATHMPTVATP